MNPGHGGNPSRWSAIAEAVSMRRRRGTDLGHPRTARGDPGEFPWERREDRERAQCSERLRRPTGARSGIRYGSLLVGQNLIETHMVRAGSASPYCTATEPSVSVDRCIALNVGEVCDDHVALRKLGNDVQAAAHGFDVGT